MSEHQLHHHEHHTLPEAAENKAESHYPNHKHERAPTGPEKPSSDNLEQLRHRIKDAALSKDEFSPRETQEPVASHIAIGKDLRNQAFYRSLKNLRHHLSGPEQTLSKIVHQPAVDAASEFSSKTIARPSGLLSGGVFAFIGSALFLYLAKHNGYHYNYLLFVLFFIGGFFVGLVLELLFWMIRRLRS